MNAMICAGREAALCQSQAWIDNEGLTEVAKAKWFVQKVPLNIIYDVSFEPFLFYSPDGATTSELRQEAAELNARKLKKIMDLEQEIKQLRLNLPELE